MRPNAEPPTPPHLTTAPSPQQTVILRVPPSTKTLCEHNNRCFGAIGRQIDSVNRPWPAVLVTWPTGGRPRGVSAGLEAEELHRFQVVLRGLHLGQEDATAEERQSLQSDKIPFFQSGQGNASLLQ